MKSTIDRWIDALMINEMQRERKKKTFSLPDDMNRRGG
jgi:hypothetical protein